MENAGIYLVIWKFFQLFGRSYGQLVIYVVVIWYIHISRLLCIVSIKIWQQCIGGEGLTSAVYG
jgi:hypothetical protein